MLGWRSALTEKGAQVGRDESAGQGYKPSLAQGNTAHEDAH